MPTPAVVHVIGDRQGRPLGRLGRGISHTRNCPQPISFAVQQGESSAAWSGASSRQSRRASRSAPRSGSLDAEEAQVELRPGTASRAYPHARPKSSGRAGRISIVVPVGQQSVKTGPSVCGHVALPVLRRLTVRRTYQHYELSGRGPPGPPPAYPCPRAASSSLTVTKMYPASVTDPARSLHEGGVRLGAAVRARA